MSRYVSDERLEILHLQISGIVRRRCKSRKSKIFLELAGDPIVEAHDISCLLDELRCRRGTAKRTANGTSQFQLGTTSKMLAQMKVGEQIEVMPMARSKLTSARATARKILDIPLAVWRCETLPNGKMLITRHPDGSSPHEPRTNHIVLGLTKMRIGEVRTFRPKKGMSKKGHMTHGMKIRARKLMNDLTANWKTERLINGDIRCKRIA